MLNTIRKTNGLNLNLNQGLKHIEEIATILKLMLLGL